MFAIIQKGGKQYKVAKGTVIDIEKIEEKEGATVNLENVLLLNKDSKTMIGTPLIEGAYVSAKVVTQKKGEKLIIYKMKAKKRYQKKTGFRRSITTLEITDIHEKGGKTEYKEEIVAEEKAPATKQKKAAKPKAETKTTTTKKTTKKKVSEDQASLL